MTIRQRLLISFTLILSIIILIIGVFFYTIYNLSDIHKSQIHRYDQLLRVERLKEFNNSFSWIVLDVITDYDKKEVVQERLNKSDRLFKKLYLKKELTINNSESAQEKKNLQLIFSHFKTVETLIKNELLTLVLSQKSASDFELFNAKFNETSKAIDILLIEEIHYLKSQVQVTEDNRTEFIDTIKLELVIALIIAFLLSFIIFSKIIQDIKEMLQKLNIGVLQLFKNDEHTIKVDIGQNNELSEITNNLNSYLEKQGDIIHSREELLRNISHELKTPITKGKFLVDRLKHHSDLQEVRDINSVFVDIEELTSKLLEREKLNAATLHKTQFKASTLILESLSKLSINDESNVELELDDDFSISADKYYMTLALKNLIDNALKYADTLPIKIEIRNTEIQVHNRAKKLSNDLIYYVQPFTREPNQQQGHGLGLNIVNKIVQLHHFKLEYSYKNSHNIFSIQF